MKRTILICVALLLLLSASASIHLVRLTVVNKSGYEASLSLVNKYELPWEAPQYWLPFPVGDRDKPGETVWTIMPGVYDGVVTYLHNGLEVYSYNEEFDFSGKAKLVLLPPSKSSELLCKDKYEDDHAVLNDCLDSLSVLRYGQEFIYKFLPTKWLLKY